MKLPFQSNMKRHLVKLSNIIRLPATKKLELKIQRNQRSFQSSVSCLYRQSLSLLRKEREVRLMRMRIDQIRRRAERVIHSFSQGQPQDTDESIDVVDSDNSELLVTQDDLEGEEQLERLEPMIQFDSGIDSYEQSSLCRLTKSDDATNRPEELSSDPLDLSYTSVGHQSKLFTPPKPSKDYGSPPRPTQFEQARPINVVTSTPIINNLPSRRSADDHLEQFMMVDPNQNIKWKQLADKFNKELGPNVCGVCHKTLSCKSALTMHYRVHTEERPFVCKVCEKRFSTKGNLKTHLGQHADVTDQYCLTPGQFKPPTAMPSPTTMHGQHPRFPLHHPGFPFHLPGLPPHHPLLFSLFSNNNVDLGLQDALKAGKKPPSNDMPPYGRAEDVGQNPCCTLCRQIFPSKMALEVHLRSQACTKDFFGGKSPTAWRERLLQGGLQGKTDPEENEDSDPRNELKSPAEKFSLPTMMGLHGHLGGVFSLLGNHAMLQRPLLPPFSGMGPQGAPRLGNPGNGFSYHYGHGLEHSK